LLLALDSGTIVVELGILLSKSIVRSLKLHVLTTGDFVGALIFTLALKGLKSLEHLLTDLLRRFQIIVEFLFVDAILSGKKLSKLGLPLLEVDSLSTAHVVDTVLDDALLDKFASLGLPMSLMSHVVVPTDVTNLFSMFEFLLTASHDMRI